MTLGEVIRHAREACHQEQKDLAAQLGISEQYLGDLERDRRGPPTHNRLQDLAVQLQLPYGYLCVLAGRIPEGMWAALVATYLAPTVADEAWATFARVLRGEETRL